MPVARTHLLGGANLNRGLSASVLQTLGPGAASHALWGAWWHPQALPLDASSTPLLSGDNQACLQTVTNVPWRWRRQECLG